MGLGIRIGAELNDSRQLRGAQDAASRLKVLLQEATDLIGHPGHIRLARASMEPEALFLRLHPAEEPIEFRIKDEALVAAAKTSAAGPGYHAFLVDFLEALGRRCRLEWTWDDGGHDYRDETGYAVARDFAALQLEMLRWLRALARYLTDDGGRGYSICLPADFHVCGEHFAVSPLGFWKRQWFDGIAAARSVESLAPRGQRFFPWWSPGRDAVFWKNCALVLCWVEVPWRPPREDDEHSVLRCAIECFGQARRLDSGLALPVDEIDELRKLATEGAVETAPIEARIGFRRRVLTRPLTARWTIALPGYFYDRAEDDGGTMTYSYGGRSVRGSSFALEARPAATGFASGGAGDAHEFRDGHLHGIARVTSSSLHGEVHAPASTCVLTFGFEDPADKDWALAAWRSVKCPPPEDQGGGRAP